MSKENQKKSSKRNIVILVLMFLLLLCLFIVQCHLENIKREAEEADKKAELEAREKYILDSLNLERQKQIEDSLRLLDSLRALDSLRLLVSLNTDTIKTDTIPQKPKINRDSLRHVKDSLDALAKAKQDSLKRALDSIAAFEKNRAVSLEKIRVQDSIRNSDKTPAQAEITPPAGRYYEPIKLKVKCDEIKCKTFLSIGDTLNPVEASKAIEYNKTGVVYFYAEDSVGNKSAWEEARYDMASDNKCGKNAYPVPVGGKEVCVDAYEYPNKPDELPRDMVSHEQAVSLCAQEGKHLCSLEEWQAACRGKDKTTYSYGSAYKQNKCNTNTSKVRRSGRKEQCRSWFGMYDMNGNLWEWTSTASKENPNMFLVAGGAWNTNNGSKCTESKYSFYPQNQYPSVGFRCCK